MCDCGNEITVLRNNLGRTAKSCGCTKLAAQDLTEQRFGRLTAMRRSAKLRGRAAAWECLCDCGKRTVVNVYSLVKGGSKSCGCHKREMARLRALDITGQRFGYLLALERAENMNNGTATAWRCVCDCGNETVVRLDQLKSGAVKSCGCYNQELASKRQLDDLTGKRFYRLTVADRNGSSPAGAVLWNCVCDCGVKTVVSAGNLRSGAVKSCGCLNVERLYSQAH